MKSFIKTIKQFTIGGDERTKKMKRNTLSMLVVKGLSVLISLAYVPLMLKYVDRTDYGILLTLTSIVHWVGMLDIGLGNGLRNSLTKNLADHDYNKAKESVSSCYAALALYVSIVVLIFVCVAPFLSWQSILNAPNNPESELLNLTIVVFVSFCVQFVINLFTSILYACQIPAYTSYIMLTTQAVNFVIVWMMIHFFGMTSIMEIGSVTCLTPPVILLAYSIILFRKKLAHIAPSFNRIRLNSVNSILALGIKFFVLQIVTIVLFQANNIIITQTVGPKAVVIYNVAYKYIGMILIIFNIINAPVWSAVTDAYVREDFGWMKKTLVYLRKMFFIILSGGVLMVVVSPIVYKLWLGEDTINIPITVTLLVLAYCAFEILYRIYGTFINGTGKLHMQMIITSIIAVIYVPSAFQLGKAIGLEGILIANTFVFIANYIWSKIQCDKIINKKATGLWNK